MTHIFGRTGLALAMTFGLMLTSAQAQEATTTAAPAAVVEVPELTLGNKDAKVSVTEYASYTCSHCADFHANVFKSLKTDYIDTDKINFTFREVYFDRYGLWASILARCGGEMRYFGINDILFNTQKDWAGSDDPQVVMDNLKKIGRTAGMDDATMTQCFADGPMAEAMVAKFQKDFEADGVEGTPTLFINGEKHSNMSYADLKVILDEELAK